ncbi:MAG: 3-hydroxyacyl-CoA dehydrogenase NAD-binding domain-containing protein [Thermoleophilaceae bacterium]
MSTIQWVQDAAGIVVLTLDDPNQSANTMNAAYTDSMRETVGRLEAESESIVGVVVTSGKKTFCAGGELNDLKKLTRADGDAFAKVVRENKSLLRRLETLGKPVVAAINGAALGGGFEIALACHHRIVVDDPKAVVGFPEVQLGLLPGAGGVARSVRMLGVVKALTQLLLKGQRLTPTQAQALGVVDEIVASPQELVDAAKAWISSGALTQQPWDADTTYVIPGGTPSSPELAQAIAVLPAGLRKQLKGANYPAPHHIIAAAVEGAQVDFDNALEVEGRYFVDLATGQVAKNMIQAFFFDMQAVRTRPRPKGAESWRPSKVAVLGAGMMGGGIAYACASAGLDVVLKDVSAEAAERGKDYSRRIVAKNLETGKLTQEQGDGLLALIQTTHNVEDAGGADLVIEAVFEDVNVKETVWKEVEPHVAADALLGSNTSTLPITGLAEFVSRPREFIGLHFFSPADRMPLLEIIRGEETSDETLYRSLDFAKLISKTAIVVNDSRGFFTSRVISAFVNEGIAMLLEGIPAPTIEQACSQAGYPVPVLQLADELNLQLMQRIRNASRAAAEADGGTWLGHPAERVIDAMADELDRSGRLRGAGFYDYDERGGRLGLWTELRNHFPATDDPSSIPIADLQERMLFAEALDSVKCLDEGVIDLVADGNVGSILGIGFPGWTGGVFQYIDGYAGGLPGFVERARQLAAIYGERFEPPATLVERAARGERISDDHPAFAAA